MSSESDSIFQKMRLGASIKVFCDYILQDLFTRCRVYDYD